MISSRFRSVELKFAHMIVGPGSIALGFISDDKPTPHRRVPGRLVRHRMRTYASLFAYLQ